MSKKVKVTLNRGGVGRLLKSEEMKNLLLKEASKVKSRCGNGYGVDTYQAGTRVISSVYTETEEAKKDNMDNNTLLKGLGT